MTRPVQHSFSALTMYESCPKKYYHIRVAKDVRDSTSADGNYGIESHKAFEHRLTRNKPLPMDLQHHEPTLAKIAAAPGQGMPEQKLAINRDFQPTGFFDDDVWIRAVVDYVKLNGKRCLVIDHKFGKMKNDFDQVKLCVAVFSCFKPEVEQYTGAYYWAKEKRITRTRLTQDDIAGVWADFLPRFEAVETAVKTTEFPARKSGLCKRHCPVLSCPHNGRS